METRTADDVIKLLNEIAELDRDAISSLLTIRFDCNEALADHPSVQVREEGDGRFSVSMLGILNGLFGTLGGDGERKDWGHIMMITTWDEEKNEPMKIEKFVRTGEK